MQFKLTSEFQPTGDQPEAIRQLIQGLQSGRSSQVLLGVTGSGKTFTVANVINEIHRPTLILSHNKTLAAQLYGEFKSFFPKMQSNILYLITIITNRKLICRQQIPISKKTSPSMTR